MTERIRLAHRQARLRRGRVVYAVLPVPAWVPDPIEPSSRLVRLLVRTRAARTWRLASVEEAVLRTASDGSAVLSVLGR